MDSYDRDVVLKALKVTDDVDFRSDTYSSLYIYIVAKNSRYYVCSSNEKSVDDRELVRYRTTLIEDINSLDKAIDQANNIIELLGYETVGFQRTGLSLKTVSETPENDSELLDTLKEIEETINSVEGDLDE